MLFKMSGKAWKMGIHFLSRKIVQLSGCIINFPLLGHAAFIPMRNVEKEIFLYLFLFVASSIGDESWKSFVDESRGFLFFISITKVIY
jgi:hypothetical protein